MNLDHDFAHVRKLSEDQKRKQMEPFSPNSGEDQKRSLPTIEHFFPQIHAQMNSDSNYWG